MGNDGIVVAMNDEFDSVGEVELRVISADRIIVGLLEDERASVALTLGYGEDSYVMLECAPWRARQIAASLLNKADAIEGLR